MGELSELTASGSTKITGSDTTGVEQRFIGSTQDSINLLGRLMINQVPGDGPNTDSYGRSRSANPNVEFAIYFSNTNHPLLLNTQTVGSGSYAYNSTLGSGRLTCTTGATDSVIVQTKRYDRYNPGVASFNGLSLIMGVAKTNVRQRIGKFDTNNGLFLEQLSTGFGVVVRSNTSGSPVDTKITQGSFNIDNLDGTGPSGITLDTSKQNLFIIDYVWQGAGRVRFGIINGGNIQYFHQITNSNVNSAPYMKSPSLPLRAELTNLAGTATSTTMDLICFATVREAIDEPFTSYTFSASTLANAKTLTSTSTFVPILSVRAKTTFNGVVNRVIVQPTHVEVLSIQDTVLLAVILNGTLTGASFTSIDTNSAAEQDRSATAISGGTVIEYFFVPGGGKGTSNIINDLNNEIMLGLDIPGTTPDVVTIAGVKINANSDTYANIVVQEYQ